MNPTTILHSFIGLGTLALLNAEEPAHASFANKHSEIAVKNAHFTDLRGSSTVVVKIGDTMQRLSTKQAKPSAPIQTTTSTPFGPATLTTVTYQPKGQPCRFTLKLKQLHNQNAFTLQGVLHNDSEEGMTFNSFDLFSQHHGDNKGLQPASPAEWLVTPLMTDKPTLPLAEVAGGLKEVALISNSAGESLLIGPIGPAEAHTTVEFREQKLKAYASMDNVLVRPGESRRTEEMIFAFGDSDASIKLWTNWVAITHGVRRHRGPVYGWCSWYDRTTKIDEAHVLDVTRTIKENPNTFGKGVIQIDDGYQKMDGDWTGNDKFPRGMAPLAKDIRDAGCIPGVWFAPLMINPDHPFCTEHPNAIQKNAKGIASFMNANAFHPAGANWLNPSHPAAKEHLFNIIRDARERGYGYIKIDFNGIGHRFVDPTKTRLQAFRDLYTLYRDAAGEEIYMLSCLGQPTRGVIGFVDSARVGPDSHPAGFAHCLDSVLRFQIFDNVWWQNDPDVSYLATEFKSRRVGKTSQGEGMWRTWHNINALVGGTAMISEPINKDDVKAQWRNYEIMRPASTEPARLLNVNLSTKEAIFGFSAQRPYGNFAVYNLYNDSEEEKHLNLSFPKAGLPTDQSCAVFDFWENKVIAQTTGSYNTVPLPVHSSALLRFTPLPADGSPTLVGSNLHLSMGATEVADIHRSSKKLTLILNPAGAQEGTLTFFSKKALSAPKAENCEVVSLENPSENIWTVQLAKRPWNQSQKITLQIQDSKP